MKTGIRMSLVILSPQSATCNSRILDHKCQWSFHWTIQSLQLVPLTMVKEMVPQPLLKTPIRRPSQSLTSKTVYNKHSNSYHSSKQLPLTSTFHSNPKLSYLYSQIWLWEDPKLSHKHSLTHSCKVLRTKFSQRSLSKLMETTVVSNLKWWILHLPSRMRHQIRGRQLLLPQSLTSYPW